MAGAGFKTFNTGDVLTSSDVNTYLMQQTVMVFDDASARSTALPTPSEGMFSYLKDTNLTYRYDGSAWLSDAGTTSPLTTKGDVWGYSTADARIPVGADGTVLTADSAEALGVKWATPAGGTDTWTTVTSSALSGLSTITISSLTYNKLILWVDAQTSASTFSDIRVRFNNSSTAADYDQAFLLGNQGATSNDYTDYKGALTAFDVTDSGNGGFWMNLFNGKSTSTKQVSFVGGSTTDPSSGTFVGYGNFNGAAAITELTVFRGSGTWTGGTLYVYGA